MTSLAGSRPPSYLARASATRSSGCSRISPRRRSKSSSPRSHRSRGVASSPTSSVTASAQINVPRGPREGSGVLLLDTSVLIELEHEVANERVGPVRSWLGKRKSEPLGCSVITVGELAAGTDEDAVRFLLRNLRKI